MYINKAMVYGNLTRDPEKRALPSGIAVTTFSIATNRVWKDREGARQESSDFHNIVVFGRQAETAAQYLHKGNSAFVEGRMQTRSWEADGQKKYRTEIVADRVQFGPKGSGGAAGAGTTGTPSSYAPQPVVASSGEETIEYPEEEINPEDIPF
ncbi:MAG: single-strand DNA-binding protein [Parcubacteria group bacterium Gr01-1014_48]|nr:MAG: single-strand DNA-binding protein [Parcubacteria group bacterium Greene0416_14]TSC73778.1 MAG: single-strand DNA-binding protein [Parcubacteria group bacterium Gr01-1014_48]TSD00645.1 MAG: single-strand DNA-binding protein [Parcubacteria group bacterium Greene1014_15]TSD08081.1 MAG: single-strand DNA-binding protein [Parcubacteria group bacterium Greene0714_4]